MSNTQAAALGRLLRTAREAKGLSMREVARQVAATQSQMFRLEGGQVSRPDPELLRRLAELLGLQLADVHELAGIAAPDLPALQPYLRARYGLGPDELSQAQRYIDRLIRKSGGDGHGPADGADEQPEN